MQSTSTAQHSTAQHSAYLHRHALRQPAVPCEPLAQAQQQAGHRLAGANGAEDGLRDHVAGELHVVHCFGQKGHQRRRLHGRQLHVRLLLGRGWGGVPATARLCASRRCRLEGREPCWWLRLAAADAESAQQEAAPRQHSPGAAAEHGCPARTQACQGRQLWTNALQQAHPQLGPGHSRSGESTRGKRHVASLSP